MATKKVTTETKKTETVTKPAAAKAEPAKTPAAKTTMEEKAPEKAAEKTTAVKTRAAKVAKKTTAKKSTAKKEIKVNAVVEYYGQQMDEKTIIANVKKAWTRSGRKVGDIKTMDLYIKPEESAVYYVINDIDTGAVALF